MVGRVKLLDRRCGRRCYRRLMVDRSRVEENAFAPSDPTSGTIPKIPFPERRRIDNNAVLRDGYSQVKFS